MQANNTFKYRAFIAYAHKDEPRAHKLRQALEAYRVPAELVGSDSPFGPVPARLFPIFRDRDELAGSADLGSAIEKALEESSHLIVLCSPPAAQSMWVNEEVRRFKAMGKADRILCLILDGEPFASLRGNPDQECLPVATRRIVNEEGLITEKPAEPAAADERSGGDGEKSAFLKIVAGLLGVGLDDLRKRDLHARHRKATLAAVASLALALGATGLAGYAIHQRNLARESHAQTEEQRKLAILELAKTQAVTQFVSELFHSIDPHNAQGMDTRLVKAMLDQGSAKAEELSDEPAIEARVRLTLGKTYRSIAAYDDAATHLARAYLLLKKLPERDDNATFAAMNELAVTYDALGDHVQAEPLLSTLLRRRERQLGAEHPDVIRARIDLANVYLRIERFEEAEELCSRALALLKEADRPEGDPDLLRCASRLAAIYLARDKLPQAETLARETLQLSRLHLGETHPDTLRRAARLTQALHALERLDEAEKLSIQTVAAMTETLGEKHPETLGSMDALARIVAARGESEDALAHYRRILAVKEEALGPMHPATFETMKAIARLQQDTGQHTEAEATTFDIYRRSEEKLGHEHPETLRVMNDLVDAYLQREKHEEAFSLSERLLETERRVLGEDDPLTLRTRARMAELHYHAGRKDQAQAAFAEVLESQERILGFDHPEVARSRTFTNRILAELSSAAQAAESNSTQPLYPNEIPEPAPSPEAVLPAPPEPETYPTPIPDEDEKGKKPGPVGRLLQNVRQAITPGKPEEGEAHEKTE